MTALRKKSPEPMLIRKEAPDDLGAIFSLHADSFVTDAEAQLVNDLREGGHLSLSLVAYDRSLIGHAAFSPMEFGDVKAAGLAPIAVAEGYRGQGIGSHLIEKGMEELKDLGYSTVFVLGSGKFYLRMGFQRAIDYGIKPPYPRTKDNFFVKELVPDALRDAGNEISYGPEFGKL